MRPWTRLREWWVNHSYEKPEELPVQSTGRNKTFRHGPQCSKPVRPCGCMPFFKVPDTETRREFWVTPHPNRKVRRQLVRMERELPVSR